MYRFSTSFPILNSSSAPIKAVAVELRNKREQTGKINVCIRKTEPSYDNNKYLLHWLESGKSVEEQWRVVKTSNEKKVGIMNE
jgi:hypothetical protein